MQTTDKASETVLFRQYSLTYLADHLPYSVSYIVDIKSGSKPMTVLFKRKVALSLGVPATVLFAADNEPQPAQQVGS